MPSVPSIDRGFMGYGSQHSQSPCRLLFKCLRGIEWNGLLKVCVDISYQVKAIEVAQNSFEEAAITDTRPLGAACAHKPAHIGPTWDLLLITFQSTN